MYFDFNQLDIVGVGGSRIVYGHPHNHQWVIKTDMMPNGFQNVMEFKIWEHVQTLPLADWLAPVVDISPDGRTLVMERVSELEFWDIPDWIPEFFNDTNISNFGMLGGQFVCCDYAMNMMWKHGASVELKSTHNLFTF